MFPLAVAAGLTVVCVATGALSLARVALPASCTPGRAESRATELLHVLMSVAMVAMTWGLAGGPDTVDGVAQIVGFGAFTATFAVLAARAAGRLRLVRSAHALMAAAMVWMVALMPTLMHTAPATAVGAPAAGGHGMHMDHRMAVAPAAAPAATGTSPWVAATTVLAALLLVAALAWGVRAVQAASPAHRSLAVADPTVARPVGAPTPAGTPVATLAPATVTAATAPRFGSAALTASCHGLMSLAMAVMLLAML